jgi:hypothetical protein
MEISSNAGVDEFSITFRKATVATQCADGSIAANSDRVDRLAALGICAAHHCFGGKEDVRWLNLEGVGA